MANREGSPEWAAIQQAEELAQCQLIRDLFGDPSQPFCFDPDWLHGEGRVAVQQAREIYSERKLESLSSLAELLEQAGCRDRAVLEHCRWPGPHIRGCWVVDALLGHETAVRTGLMTEADWQTCNDPDPLLHFLRDKSSMRKWRLFAVACCGRIDGWITDLRSRLAVEVAARFADGTATEEELEPARSAAEAAQDEAARAEYLAEAEANFCVAPAYATICCSLYATLAAQSAVCRDPRMTDAEPGSFEADQWGSTDSWAAATVHYQVLAKSEDLSGEAGRQKAYCAAVSVQAAELQFHCQLLRDLFGEYLGPPGDRGAWLRSEPGALGAPHGDE